MRKFLLAVSALLILTSPLLGQSATLPQLEEATELGDDDVLLVRQDGDTRDKKVKWSTVASELDFLPASPSVEELPAPPPQSLGPMSLESKWCPEGSAISFNGLQGSFTLSVVAERLSGGADLLTFSVVDGTATPAVTSVTDYFQVLGIELIPEEGQEDIYGSLIYPGMCNGFEGRSISQLSLPPDYVKTLWAYPSPQTISTGTDILMLTTEEAGGGEVTLALLYRDGEGDLQAITSVVPETEYEGGEPFTLSWPGPEVSNVEYVALGSITFLEVGSIYGGPTTPVPEFETVYSITNRVSSIGLFPTTAEPPNPQEGRIYFNEGTKTWCGWANSRWHPLGGEGGCWQIGGDEV